MTGRVRTWALRLSLAAVAVILGLAGLFVWRAMNGPVSLGFMAPQLESMINAGLSGARIRFDDSVIAWSDERDLAHLQFIGLRVVDENEGVIARIPKANVTLSGPELLRGVAAPTSIELVGVSANVVRRSSGDIQLGLQVGVPRKQSPTDTAATPSNVPADMLRYMLEPGETDTLTRSLKRFSITQARLSVFDEETRSSWIADKATLTFQRRTNGVTVSLRAPVKLADGKSWQFSGAARYTKGKPDVAIEADFRPVRLSQLAGNGTGLQFLKGIDIPVGGNLACGMNIKGDIGRCKFWLTAGEGDLHLPALKHDPVHLREAALKAEIDLATGRYTLSEMTWKGNTIRGEVKGEGEVRFADDGGLQSLSADWTADNIFMDAPNLFERGFALETARFRGTFDAKAQTLAIDELLARQGSFQLTLAGALTDHPVSMGVKLSGNVQDLSIPDLKMLWPAGTVPGARDWIMANIHEGTIRRADIDVDLVPGAMVDERIPDEMMTISLDLAALRVTYLAGLPDIVGVDGSAVLNGDTFRGELKSGNVGAVRLRKGSILINELHKTGAIGNIEGSMAGPTRDLLMLIDMPRLGYPTRYGIPAAKAAGTANVDFVFAIPMLKDVKTEDIGIQVNAELLDIKLPINQRFGLTGGKFSLDLDTKGMKAIGAVRINDAPVGFHWREDFTGTEPNGTRIDVTATMDDGDREVFGLDVAPYVEGRTEIVAQLTGNSGKIQAAVVNANLTGARLAIPQLNWAKPEDAIARLQANVKLKANDVIEVASLELTGREMKASGRIIISDGQVSEADFTRIELGRRNDFSLSYKALPTRATTVAVKGRAIDVAGLDEGEPEEAPAKKPVDGVAPGSPLAVAADIANLHLKAGVSWTGVSLNYADDGRHLTRLSLSALDQSTRISGDLTTGSDGSRKLALRAADAGRLLRGLTGFRSLIGGALSVDADLAPIAPTSRRQDAFDGRVIIDDFRIVDQPFFARLLSAGSFTGLADLLRGEGVTFSRLEQTVKGRGGVLTLSNGRASGPSIGLTLQGTYNRDNERLDLNGTIVPIYGLNSMFEAVPLVNDILGSKDGEGIFAVTYGVKGDVDNLKVSVNPISVLAPGFLRRVFQDDKPEVASPMPLPMPQPVLPAKAPEKK
jgi:hypothetical protein